MTLKTDSIKTIDDYLRAGKSICPYAKKAEIHYAVDNEPLWPMMRAIKRYEAGVVICLRRVSMDFWTTKIWAQDTILTMFVATAQHGNPQWSHRQAREHVYAHIGPVLRNDNDPRRPALAVDGKPMVPICMAPVYPTTHPRFSPIPIIVVTWYEDLHGVVIPAVRDAMAKEHGSVYDALEIMLPLPKKLTVEAANVGG